MTKRKQQRNNDGPRFHQKFVVPSLPERRDALGSFPGAAHAAPHREAMLKQANRNITEFGFEAPSLLESLVEVDEERLYQPAGKRSMTTMAVPKPRDEQDWLACVPEEGQTFDEYIQFQTTRAGKFKKIANTGFDHIVLLPIVRSSASNKWPEHGIPLEPLVPMTKSFFHRPVRLFPAAVLYEYDPSGGKQKTTQGLDISFTMKFPSSSVTQSSHQGPQAIVRGRKDSITGRVQLNLDDILYEFKQYREDRNIAAADGGEPLPTSSFCVMAITMEDLYSDPTDLFVSGMANGGDKVAVFSFSRYHPHIKMHPGDWYNFGYSEKAGNYSYYEEDANNHNTGRKKAKKHTKPTETILRQESPNYKGMTKQAQTEFLRRCAKILVHELGHLYGLDHCIFNRCIMNGTGHLVEDFLAPFHLCPVCLRKLQWRLGFSVIHRYKQLADSLKELGMEKEEKWVRKQVETLERM